jgi:hypothetical protein
MASRDRAGFYAPGTYNFKKVFLRDHDVDIRFKILEINIFESIFQPCMTADITVLDAENMLANLPITEGDVVDIHLSFNEDDKIQQNIDGEEIKCAMEIIKITSRIKTSQQDVQTYNLRLASPGWSSNVRTRISRAYKNKKYSDVVKEIFNDKLHMKNVIGLRGEYSKFNGNDSNDSDLKDIDIEDTHGEYSFIIPRWKPIQAINWLAGRSQSGDNKNAVNYVFYEDKNTYNFKSINSLIEQEPTETYYVKLQNVNKLDEKNYQNIHDYTYEDTGDVLLHASSGTFGSRLIVHNMVTKEVDDHFPQGLWSLNYNIHGYPANQDEFGTIGVDRFGYKEEFKKTSHTDGVPLIPNSVADTLSENPGNTRLLVRSTHRYQYEGIKTDHPEEWMRQRIMQKPQAKYIRLTIQTLGNFRRKAGETINIDLPSPQGNKEGEDIKDARLKGKYLVTSVRRVFKPTKHEVIMECMKDSFASEGGQ